MLGRHLSPADGFVAPGREVEAVHISELTDPAAYLGGGELLMTTGLSLPGSDAGCRSYVQRLMAADVRALALGLGPVFSRPPTRLVRACHAANLPLLVVPASTPFLTVSQAYWRARARATERKLADALAAHRTLVDAAAGFDAGPTILRRLSQLVDGWAATLDTGGAVIDLYPPGVHDLGVLRDSAERLRAADTLSSLSLSTDDGAVVAYPLRTSERVVGFLAVGTPRPLEAPMRHVVLTAVALLSVHALHAETALSADDVTRRCLATLVDRGHLEAARSLAADNGLGPVWDAGCVAAIEGREVGGLARVVSQWCPEALGVTLGATRAWFLLPGDHPPPEALWGRLVSVDPLVKLAISELVGMAMAGAARAGVQRRLVAMRPGDSWWPRRVDPVDVRRAVDRFVTQGSRDLQEAMVEHLRCRGNWERMARVTGLHRNTLRYRVARAREELGVDLDDPDVFAEVWLALRARGVA